MTAAEYVLCRIHTLTVPEMFGLWTTLEYSVRKPKNVLCSLLWMQDSTDAPNNRKRMHCVSFPMAISWRLATTAYTFLHSVLYKIFSFPEKHEYELKFQSISEMNESVIICFTLILWWANLITYFPCRKRVKYRFILSSVHTCFFIPSEVYVGNTS